MCQEKKGGSLPPRSGPTYCSPFAILTICYFGDSASRYLYRLRPVQDGFPGVRQTLKSGLVQGCFASAADFCPSSNLRYQVPPIRIHPSSTTTACGARGRLGPEIGRICWTRTFTLTVPKNPSAE